MQYEANPVDESIDNESYYVSRLWHPSLTEFVPNGVSLKPFMMWWLFHELGIFMNKGYAIFLIYYDNQIVHRSCIFPGYFRFPFMQKQDLQIGDTWTHPDHRGKGLATYALHEILRLRGKQGQSFWYIVEEENLASIRVVEKAGFSKVGRGIRTKRFGVSLLGSYIIQQAF